MSFSCTVTILVQFATLKVCNFFVLFQYIYILLKKKWKIIFWKKLHETDTSVDFLTVEKVAVSLPIKCLRNPTSGSVLIGG